MRIFSPRSHVKPNTPPPQKSRKKHCQEKYEKQLQTNTIVVDDDLDEKDSNRFIVIDDSDSDDDVKVNIIVIHNLKERESLVCFRC